MTQLLTIFPSWSATTLNSNSSNHFGLQKLPFSFTFRIFYMFVYFFLSCWPSYNSSLSLHINSLCKPFLPPLRLISNCFYDYSYFSPFYYCYYYCYFCHPYYHLFSIPISKLHTYYILIQVCLLLTFCPICFIICSLSPNLYIHSEYIHTSYIYIHTHTLCNSIYNI